MIDPTVRVDGNEVAEAWLTRPISLKHISRKAAHAAERDAIFKMLELTGWNRVRAAKLLEISYRALLYKIKYLGSRRHEGRWARTLR